MNSSINSENPLTFRLTGFVVFIVKKGKERKGPPRVLGGCLYFMRGEIVVLSTIC